jgi:hypothetical protein
MFLYECQWILPVQLTEDGYAHVLDDAGRARVLEVLAACARHVTEQRLFEYDATALPLESRLLLQLLSGRGIPSWVPAFRDHLGTVLMHAADPNGVVVRESDGAPAPVTPTVEAPDYFGQRLLHRWVAVAPTAQTVESDGVRRPIDDRGAGDTAGQQQDRLRRRVFGQLRRAVPAREAEVRVWKPVPGPLGSLWERLLWDLRLVKHRGRRWAGRLRGR